MRNDMRANIYRSEYLSEGYTMTREDGWFDFMVNGGGAVTLQFGKSPFPPKIETLFAPWNEVSAAWVSVTNAKRAPYSLSPENIEKNVLVWTAKKCINHDMPWPRSPSS